MASWRRRLAMETHAQFLAVATGFNGDKGDHLGKFKRDLLGIEPEKRGDERPALAAPDAEPLDLESDRARELQAEMDAERDMFERVLARKREAQS